MIYQLLNGYHCVGHRGLDGSFVPSQWFETRREAQDYLRDFCN